MHARRDHRDHCNYQCMRCQPKYLKMYRKNGAAGCCTTCCRIILLGTTCSLCSPFLPQPCIAYSICESLSLLCAQLKPDAGYTEPHDAELRAWVAARFTAESYPAEFTLGDGQRQIIGSYFNRPLRFGRRHRVFVRALAPHNVS